MSAASEPRVAQSAGALANGDRSPRVAIVVPVFNGEALVEACAGAILTTTDAGELLLVDDGSSDASVAAARRCEARWPGRVRVLETGRNGGFAAAVNRGVADLLAGHRPPQRIVLVNQDCVVRPGWLAPLLRALDDPGVAIAGARLLEADGVTLQHAGARIEANGLTTHFGRGSRDPGAWRKPAEADYVCGALVALRTSTWERIGAFDEGYAPAYFEEVDWCLRARRAGLRVVYVPSSEAVHAEASCSGHASRLFLERYHRSRLRLVVRWIAPQRGWPAWLRAELAWLRTLRRSGEIAPLLSAYALLPALLREQRQERMRKRMLDRMQREPAR